MKLLKRNIALLILLISMFKCGVSFAQNRIIDSLEKLLLTSSQDTNKVKVYNQLCSRLALNDPDKADKYNDEAIVLAKSLKDKRLISNCYQVYGVIWSTRGIPDSIIYYQTKALELRKEIGWKKGIASSLNNIGQGYVLSDNYPNALSYFIEATKIAEEIHDSVVLAGTFNNLGMVYKLNGQYDKALDSYSKSLEIKRRNNDRKGCASTILNIGIIHNLKNELLPAKEKFMEALEIYISEKFLQGQSMAYNNLGALFYDLKDYKEALKMNKQSLVIKETLGDNAGIVASLTNIGSDYYALKNYKEAINNHLAALNRAIELGLLQSQVNCYEMLGKDYSAEGDYKNAYLFHKKCAVVKDSILNAEKAEQMAEMQTKYESEKKDKEILKKNSELSQKELESKNKTIQRNIFILGFALVLLTAIFILRGFFLKKKANQLITQQKEVIEEKNREVMDSINYARRIQAALLPPYKLITKSFKESFVLYQPKDIVSGDFYWFEKIGDKLFIAAVDCTGHGVPGAMVSVIGHNGLNRAVHEFKLTTPAAILDKLAVLVDETFVKSDSEVKDGMDISLCCYDPQSNILQWAGANNPLWICQNNKVLEIRADKQPIGSFENRKQFTNHSFTLNSGDSFYLFTDGFADQFGGPKGKKFKYKQLSDLIELNSGLSMEQQKNALIDAFNAWKGNLEQVDDICLIGIRI